MVDLINASVGGGAGQAVSFTGFSSKSSADTSLPAATSQASVPQSNVQTTPDDQATQNLLAKRMTALKDAITAALPLFFYPLGTERFTIYKAPSGQYITSVTDIRTGQTKEIAEPELMNKISNIGDGLSFIDTSV